MSNVLRRVALLGMTVALDANAAPVQSATTLVAPPASPVTFRSASRLAWATALPKLVLRNKGTAAQTEIRLYTEAGDVDSRALELMNAAAGSLEHPLAPRVAQLLVKAATHFGVSEVTLVSAYRSGHAGKHSTSEAVDFDMPGVRAGALASYLRTLPKVGVGIYTHPKTRYVHLDVREESFHWLDASPPGRTWREKGITDRSAHERDAAYTSADDLPEH